MGVDEVAPLEQEPAPGHMSEALRLAQGLFAVVFAPSLALAYATRRLPQKTRALLALAALLAGAGMAWATQMLPALGLLLTLLHAGNDLFTHSHFDWAQLILWALPTWLLAVPFAELAVAKKEIDAYKEHRRQRQQHGGSPTPTSFDLGGGFYLDWEEHLRQHIFSVGSTGSGKTETLLRLASEALKAKKNLVFIDGKGEDELIDRMRQICEEAGRSLKVWTVENDLCWNPLAGGTAGSRASLVVGALSRGEGNAEYYKMQSYAFLQRLFIALDRLEPQQKPTLQRVSALMDPDALKHFVAAGADEELISLVLPYLANLSASEKSAIRGLSGYIDGLVLTGSKGKWGQGFALSDAKDGEVLLFSVGSSLYSEFAPILGRMLLGDALAMTDLQKLNMLLIVDEFTAFNDIEMPTRNLLARARSAGLTTAWATQGFADFAAVSPTLGEKMLQNTNVILLGRCNDLGLEDLLKTLGTQAHGIMTMRTTDGKATGEGSFFAGQTFKIDPNVVRELAAGEIFAIVKSPPPMRYLKIKVRRWLPTEAA